MSSLTLNDDGNVIVFSMQTLVERVKICIITLSLIILKGVQSG